MILERLKKRKSIDNDPCIITIYGEPASKANSRRLVSMGGRPRFIKSKKALLYGKNFDKQCPVRKEPFGKKEDLAVAMKIFYKTRRPDLDESLILDLLQGRVYENDRSVKSKFIEHGLDKEHPRSVIVISGLDNKDLVRTTLLEVLSREEE
jgi:Holliday junction resolvase RusA-like endonuclease